MFEMLGVADRSAVVLCLKGYQEVLRMAPGRSVIVGGVTVNVQNELRKIAPLVERFTNQFVYVSDEVMDRAKLYKQGAERQPEFIKLLTELLALVNSAQVTRCPDHETEIDIDATNRMREIVSVLNAGGGK